MMILEAILIMSFTACNNSGAKLPHYDETSTVNNRLFYKNELKHVGADPDCIYITEGEDAGYFYLYATSDAVMNKGFIGWRSKNLNDWEAAGVAFMAEKNSLCNTMLWAPEVIYNPDDGLYYMYYSARRSDYVMAEAGDIEYLTLCVAYSDSPRGPFKQWEGVNALGERMTIRDELINFQKHLKTERHWCTIDASPFFDEDGTLYLYFSNSDPVDSSNNGVWGMKMLDAVTPDYSSVKQLTVPGSAKVKEYSYFSADGENINEAPYMYKHNGKYYLTYSSYGFTHPLYRVNVAIGDSPLGDFEKVPVELGNPVLGKEPYFDHMSGTGHHSFVRAGDQLFAVYHAHSDRTMPYNHQSGRCIAFDEAVFVYNETLGCDMLHVNGPTYSVQPLPEVFSGYRNVLKDAEITATNVKEGAASLLQDGAVSIHPYDLQNEVVFDGSTKITVKFRETKRIVAAMVYNSSEISLAFDKLDYVKLFLDDSLLEKDSKYKGIGSLIAEDIPFNRDYFLEDMFVRPGGAAICEFDELPVTKIEIGISSKYMKGEDALFAVSEIAVLGKSR